VMLPNPSAQFWATPVGTPQFFSDGSAQRYLSPKDIVLTLPWGGEGRSMQWQAQCGMCFRNVSGWTGPERFEVRRWPIVNYFLGSPDLPDPGLQLQAFLANTGVTAIAIDDSDPRAGEFNAVVSATGLTAQKLSGISLFRLSAGQFSEFNKVTGLEMERRVDQYRFGMLLLATDNYLRAGHPLSQISSEQLVALGFLPASWKQAPNRLYDLYVMPLSKSHVVIGELGSPSALADVVARYRAAAQTVFLPFPHVVAEAGKSSFLVRMLKNALLTPAAMAVDGESMEFLGLGFDRDQLHRAASIADAQVAAAGQFSSNR
jgi:hypothetical protein